MYTALSCFVNLCRIHCFPILVAEDFNFQTLSILLPILLKQLHLLKKKIHTHFCANKSCTLLKRMAYSYYISFLERYFDFLYYSLTVFSFALFSLNLLLGLPIYPNSSVEGLLAQFPTQFNLCLPCRMLWCPPGWQYSSQPGNSFTSSLPWVLCFMFPWLLLDLVPLFFF